MFFFDIASQAAPSSAWAAVAAVGSVAAVVVALGIALRDTWTRSRDRKQRARIYGTSYDMRIGVAAAAAVHAHQIASASAKIDPRPETLATIAGWAAHAAGILGHEDVTRLADAIPRAAEHLAAGVASLHVADQLSASIAHESAPELAEMRRINLVQLCGILESAVTQLNAAKRLCRDEAAIKLGSNP